MRKVFILIILFGVIVTSAFTQSVLRDGIYMMQGSQDMFHIHYITQYPGNFQATLFANGSFTNVMAHQAGYTIGNQMYSTVFWIAPYLSGVLPVGTQSVYFISNNTTFVDGAGQVWTWRRDMPR